MIVCKTGGAREEEEAKFVEEQRQFVGRSANLQGLAESDTESEEEEEEWVLHCLFFI